MLAPQVKLADNSAEPRLVVERRLTRPGDRPDRLLHGPRDHRFHLVRRAVAGVDGHGDAREENVREQSDRHGEAADHARPDQHEEQGQERAAPARDDFAERHLARAFTAMPSWSS